MMMYRNKRNSFSPCVFDGCAVRGISGNRVLLQGCPISLSWEWSSNQTERGGGKGKGEINPYQTSNTHRYKCTYSMHTQTQRYTQTHVSQHHCSFTRS